MNNLERVGRFGSCHELSVSDSLIGLQVLMAEQFLQTIENITNTQLLTTHHQTFANS